MRSLLILDQFSALKLEIYQISSYKCNLRVKNNQIFDMRRYRLHRFKKWRNRMGDFRELERINLTLYKLVDIMSETRLVRERKRGSTERESDKERAKVWGSHLSHGPFSCKSILVREREKKRNSVGKKVEKKIERKDIRNGPQAWGFRSKCFEISCIFSWKDSKIWKKISYFKWRSAFSCRKILN